MGIIGGADGPTAVFMTGSLKGVLVAAGVVLAAAVLAVYLWRNKKGKKYKRRNRNIKCNKRIFKK